MRRAAGVLLLLSGCTGVKGDFRCADSSACVLEGRHGGRCEPSGYCSFADPTCEEQQRYGPWSGSFSEVCVGQVPQDRPDARETGGSDNDSPTSPYRLEGPDEEVAFDLDPARPDVSTSFCDSRGMPDLFYAFTIFQEEVVYLAASGDGAIMTVLRGECGTSGVPDLGLTCGEKSCQEATSAIAQDLFPGTYCVILSGYGQGTLRYLRGGRAGLPANQGENYVETCDAPDLTRPTCRPGGGDSAEAAFFLAACHGQLDAVSGDGSILYVREGSALSGDVACGANFVSTATNLDLYWVFEESSTTCLSGAALSINW